MARLSFVALLALAFSGVAFAAPHDGPLGVLHARGNQEYYPCGGTSDISSVDVSPVPAVSGQDLSVAVNAFAHLEVTPNAFATVYILDKASGRVVGSPQHVDFCQGRCPIRPGPYQFAYDIALPEDYSPSQLSITTRGISGDLPIFCFVFSPY